MRINEYNDEITEYRCEFKIILRFIKYDIFLSKTHKKLIYVNIWVFFTFTNKEYYEKYSENIEFW
jgi:hypothetical protein